MTRIIIATLIALSFVGTAQAKDKEGTFGHYGIPTCGEYLDAYSKSTLSSSASAFVGQYEMWNITGWINGYLTAYNQFVNNGKADILDSMTMNDTRRWIASWCRDNPSKIVLYGLVQLTTNLNK